MSSELSKDRVLVTHKFACDHCDNAETFVIPYVAPGTKNAA